MLESLLIPLLSAFSAFLFAISLIPSKSALSLTVESLEGRGAPGATPSTNKLQRAVENVLSPERTGGLQRKLLEAGWYTVTPAQIVLRCFACAIAGVVAALLIGRVLNVGPILGITLQVLVFIFAAYLPISMLERAAESRKDQVQRALPDFLDMIASTVQAGLAINAALAYAIDAAPGALGDEIKEALSEIRLGRSRADALKAAADRLNQEEFTTTVAAITQAERLGSNVGNILSELADDTRSHRILRVEEHAATLPVKMVFPMAFFLLPALFVIIFGSLIANYFAQPG